MRITSLLLFFIITMLGAHAQSFSIVKGSVYCVSTVSDVVEARDSKISAAEFSKGDVIHLTEGWILRTIRSKAKTHLFFSNKMHVWVGGDTTLYVDNFEHFVDKDENKKAIPDDGAFVGNFRINGTADFKIEKISESGFFNITTTGASLETASKHFFVATSGRITYVECYDGRITMTNSSTMKDAVLEAGNRAKIFGQEGETNLLIEITPLTEEQKVAAKARLTEEATPVWNFVSVFSPKIP